MGCTDCYTAAIVLAIAMFAALFHPFTVGRKDYDPAEVAKDGPFRAPRVWLHVQKILIGCTVYAVGLAVFLGLDWSPWGDYGDAASAIAVLGPLLFAIVREHVAPTDPDKHTWAEHATDTFTDGALYSIPVVLEYVAGGQIFAAGLYLSAIIATYRLCRNGARP